jgi:putative FmdB family regulatory protein
MPLYEYQCASCEKRFELIRKFSDPPLTACPTCGGAVEKLVSSPAFQFKGSGFYITDYARKGEPADGPAKPVKKDDAPSSSAESSKAADAGDKTKSVPSAPAAPAASSATASKGESPKANKD